MPIPRSKPSTMTYIVMATPRIAAQRSGSQKAQPTYSVPKPNMQVLLIRRVEAGALCALGRLPDLRRAAKRAASASWPGSRGRRCYRPGGPFTQDLGQVVAAEPEHDHVDAEKRDE